MSEPEQHGRRLQLPVVTLAVLLVLAGAVTLMVGLRAQIHPPQPPTSAGIQLSAPSSTTAGGSPTAPAWPVAPLPPSPPRHLSIPAIGVSSDLIELGLNPNHTVQVPPLNKDSKAGWYRYSPTPGALGPAVLLGHVDSAANGPAIFFRLGALRPGDRVAVTRADGITAIFQVERVVSYPKKAFPTQEVYGNTDHAALRLITCGGRFDAHTGSYLSDIVAYASLIDSHPPSSSPSATKTAASPTSHV